MKNLLLVCTLALATPVAAWAQAPALPRANVVVLHPADSARAAYARLGQVLVAAGYDLEKASYDADKAFYLRQANYKLPDTSPQVGYLTTISRSLPERPELRVALQAAVLLGPAGATVELRGTYTLDGLKFSPVANQGKAGSPPTQAWAELQRVAALYAAGIPAEYRREDTPPPTPR